MARKIAILVRELTRVPRLIAEGEFRVMSLAARSLKRRVMPA